MTLEAPAVNAQRLNQESTDGRPPTTVWKVRVVKAYAEAHNHILVGHVVDRNPVFIELHCLSFHFGRSVNSLKDVYKGDYAVRIVPWSRVEVINVLPAAFRTGAARLTRDEDGNIILVDRGHRCPVISPRESRH